MLVNWIEEVYQTRGSGSTRATSLFARLHSHGKHVDFGRSPVNVWIVKL
jgi:hypothetical protein